MKREDPWVADTPKPARWKNAVIAVLALACAVLASAAAYTAHQAAAAQQAIACLQSDLVQRKGLERAKQAEIDSLRPLAGAAEYWADHAAIAGGWDRLYHNPGCKMSTTGGRPMLMEDIIAAGYKPCPYCH